MATRKMHALVQVHLTTADQREIRVAYLVSAIEEEYIAILFVGLLHKWKKNTLLSIAGGTILYMLLVQRVF